MPRAPRGHALLGFLFLAGLAASVVAALLGLRSAGSPGPLWFSGGLALSAASGWALARRNLVGLLQLLLFCTLTPAMLLGLGALLVPGEQPGAVRGALLLLLLAALPATALWRELRRPEHLPNVLLELAPAAHIVERDGLQLCAQATQLPSGALELRVAVQSCVDQERRLVLRLRGPSARRLAYPTQVEARLGPAEVGLLRVALHPTATLGAPGPLHLRPLVSGPAATRVRHWRARALSGEPHPLLQILLAAHGHLHWGGGWRVELPLRPDAPAFEQPVPSATWELLWSPDGVRSPPQPARAA